MKKPLPIEYEHESWSTNIPQQENTSGCGVFACKFADYISRDLAINLKQSDMPTFRKQIAYAIIKNHIL